MKARLLTFFETLLVALCGGVLFVLLHVPLAWMLGPLSAVMAWHLLTKRALYWPTLFRELSSLALGYLLGASFSRETALQIAGQLPQMLIVTTLTVLLSITMGYYVAKAAGVATASGVFGNVPGGLTQMVLVSEEIKDADPTVVTFMQMIRLLGVIFLVPFLTVHGLADLVEHSAAPNTSTAPLATALSLPDTHWYNYLLFFAVALLGAWLGKKVHLPAATLNGPLFATAALILISGMPAPQLPADTITVAQLLIGVHIGLQMKVQNLGNIKKLTVLTVLSSVLLVLFALGLGILLARFNGMTLTTGFLSTAPGGIAEMGITATLVHADLSTVTGYQLFRIFFIMFAVPPLLKWWLNRRAHKETGSPSPS